LSGYGDALLPRSRVLLSLLLIWILVCQTVAAPRVTINLPAREASASTTPKHSASYWDRGRPARNPWLTRLANGLWSAVTTNILVHPNFPPYDPVRPELTDTVIARHHPTLNSGRIEGTLRLLQPEPFTLNGNTQIAGDLFLPGTPAIQLNGGAQHGGLVTDEGSAIPSYTVTLSGNINLPGKIHTHVDARGLPEDFPSSVPAPTGTRNVTIRTQSDIAAIGDWQTVRDLNVKASRLAIDVPPGNYGAFTVNGNSRLNFSAGTYNFANTFNLDGSASLQTTGRVTINVGQNLIITSGAVVSGSYTSPGDVRLNVLGTSVNINGSSQVSGLVRADHGNVSVNGTALVRGQVIADTFTLNGGKVIGAVWPVRTTTGFTILGPRRFDRTTGPPNQYLEQFSLPAGGTAPYTLHIQNRGEGTDRVSSATVKLNGAEILLPSDLNQNVANIDRPVSLSEANSLEVRLASNPGSYLIIDISAAAQVKDTSPPTVSITTPIDGSSTSNNAVDINGIAVDTGAAASGVAHVYVNELEAVFNPANSTWTIAVVPLVIGVNEITVRAIDQAGNQSTTSLNITREAPNAPPTVNAGADQTFSLPHAAALQGTSGDDGLPEGSHLTTIWSVVSNPGPVVFSDSHALNTSATFTTAGTYVLRLTASDGTLSAADELTLTIQPANQPPTVNAGPNQTIALPHTATLTGSATDDGLPLAANLVTSWTQVSGPGTVAFEDSSQTETTASFSSPGAYVLRLTASDNELTAISEVTIDVNPQNQAPTVNAGLDQIVSLPNAIQLNGSMSDDGWPAGSNLSVVWSTISGPAPVAFDNSTVTVTPASFSVPGSYLLRLTVSDGELSGSDDLLVTVTPPNQPPNVNAGPDREIILPVSTANLGGLITDDGLPLGSSVSSSWSKVSGPGEVSFSRPDAAETTAQFSTHGEYTLRLTVTDGAFTVTDEVVVHVIPENHAPTVSAGTDQTIALPASAHLNGSAGDDGFPAGSTIGTTWSMISGPAPVSFSETNVSVTDAVFSAAGTYVLRLTASDSQLSSTDDVIINVEPQNQPPEVNAGSDQAITLPAHANLSAIINDDGWPRDSRVSVIWTQLSGPGTATFSSPNTNATTVTFSESGTYGLRLTASDSQLSSTDELVVTVVAENHAPTVTAGTDQSITLPATANLNASVSDDGLPSGSSLTTTWSKLSGPGNVTFASPSQTVTSATFTEPGSYVLRLTAFDSELTTSDDLTVTVIPENHAPAVNAGADQTITFPGLANLNGSVSDDGLPQGSALTTTWTKLSGPGSVVFSNPNSSISSAAFSSPGAYVLRLAASDTELAANDDIAVTVIDPRVPPSADFVVPESTGAAGAFVIASSGATSSTLAADKTLDSDNLTYWNTAGASNQFAKIQFFDQQMVFLDRVRLQSRQGAVSNLTLKDFEVQISATTADDASFTTALTATLINNGQLQEFVFPGGPQRARYLKLIAKNNYGGANNITLGTFNPVAVGSADSIISLPGQSNVALGQSPALTANGGAIYTSSYSGGTNSATNLLGYFAGGWQTGGTTNEFAVIQLAGGKSYMLQGVRLATWWDTGHGFPTGVKDFEVWVSNTTPDDAAFTRVLSATAAFVPYSQPFYFPGGPVAARYVKYVPLTNGGGGTTFNTQLFDVIAAGAARVVDVSSESGIYPNSAQAAFDGVTTTNWIATGTLTNVWVKTALANDVTQRIYGVRIQPLTDISNLQGPKDFDIRVSTTTTDDSAFATVYSSTVAPIFNSPAQEFLFSNPIDARYVQFVWKNAYNASLVGVKELEVLAAPDRGSAIVGFSSQAGALDTPGNAIDIDQIDRAWVTALNQNTNQWLKLQLPRPELWSINHIALRPGPASNDLNRSPKDFELQVSTTNSADASFTTVLAGTLLNSTQLQDFYFPTTTARFVRLLLKNNYGSGQIGLSSFYIYAGDLIGRSTRFVDRSFDSDGQIVSWSWNFGDGTTSGERHPAHTFPAPGDYIVTLTVTDDSGLTSTRQMLYHVATTLQPDFACSPMIAHEGGEAVRFTDVTPLLVRSSAIRQYDFGDGSTLSQSANTSVHTFADNGVFHVKLKIGDPLGASYTATRDVTVLNLPPSVDIDPGKTIVWGEPWTSVPKIADQGPIDNQTLQGQWVFGDGQTSQCVNCTNANATVVHTYNTPGTYNAVLTVTDKDGGAGSDNATFEVNKRPTSFVLQNPPAQTTGTGLLLHGELRDTFAGQPLPGKPVQFTLNGAVFNVTSGANGVAEVSVPLPAGTRIDIATGSFAGDDFYLSSSGVGVPPTAGSTTPGGSKTNQGTDFWLMFPSAYFIGGLPVQKIFISSAVATSGTVTVPGTNFTQGFSVPANGLATVTLPFVQVTESDLIQAKGIHVTSLQPVAVYGLNQRTFSTDAFLGLPVTSLGTDYYVLTYSNMPFAPSSEFGIVASQNATTVTITPSVTTGTRIAGVSYAITLEQGQTYQLQNTDPTLQGDLSGSRVTATKPIGIFSGHMAATIPAEVGCCADHLLEQLPPVTAWGKRFATMPLATRTKGDYFRFLAAEDDTSVYLDGRLTATLNRGQFAERVLKTPSEIIATRPILLAQYATSIYYDNGTTGKADPFLMIIPPYSQFLSHYTVATPPSGFQINYANIIAPTAMLGSITIDGAPISANAFTPVGVSGYSGAQVPLIVGAHTLDGPAAFGVFAYGFAQDEGYGYPGGMNLIPTVAATNITATPEVATHSINTEACVVATATDENQIPLGGRTIAFTITGANPSSVSLLTNAAGQATLCYLGGRVGTDQVSTALGSAHATASIIWLAPNQPPAVNAGVDQTITLPAVANLQGTVIDDGLPANNLSVLWSKVSGPGNVAFGNPAVATTSATFAAAGAYVLRLTASDTSLSASDDVQIIVSPALLNHAPTVDAGGDRSITLNGNLILNPGNEEPLIGGEVPRWIEVEGSSWRQGTADSTAGFPAAERGAAYFYAGDVARAELRQDIDVTAFAGSAAGTQQFQFQAYLRSLSEPAPDTAEVIVEYRDVTNSFVIATLDSGPINSSAQWHLTEDTRTAPLGTGWIRVRLLATRHSGGTNDAFFDSITLRPVGTAALKLEGTASDDGLPSGNSLSANWSRVTGPGPVLFSNSQAASAGAEFVTAGSYLLRLTASDGELSATDDLTVTINAANQAPVVSAGQDQAITLPDTIALNAVATDDGLPAGGSVSISWSQMSGPGIVTFADATSVNTNARFSTPGVYVLRLTADDTEYASRAEVTITVHAAPENQPPTVTAGADQIVALPSGAVTLNGNAADDGLPAGTPMTVVWTQVSGPGLVTFSQPNSPITSAQFSVPGNYVLRLTASDGALSATDEVNVTVTSANQSPAANAGADQTVLLSQGAMLNGSASDDGLPIASSLTTTWSMVSGPGNVTFANSHVTVTTAQFSATGAYILRLTANDGELSAFDELAVTVKDDVPLPVVAITSPADGDELTAPSLVTGSVSNGSWVLEYSLNSEDGSANQAWREVAAGNSPVSNGALGSLDATLMLNGIYSLRLRSTDAYGQTSFTSISVLLDKNLKVGHFQIAFSDLSVPVAGLPIEVVRSYDSRDNRSGDFGVGWQLGIKSARVEKTGALGFSWLETVSSGAIPTYCLEPGRPHKVAITFGDGQVFKFQAATAIHCQQFAPVTSTRLTFTPEPGTHATLEAVGATDVLVETQGALPGPVRLINQNNPDIFNASTFRLTTAEGAVYVIDQRTGVSSVRDSYGNTLTIGAAGIIHSSGQSIAFTRDHANRITQITDPNGNAQSYSYDEHGDLVSYSDREHHNTTYTYNPDHRLLTITDARGTTPLQNQFDATGRLNGQVDALGQTLAYDHDVAGRVETITDRLGHATRYEYDERGNVLRQVDAKGGVRSFTYDFFDNLLSETNQLGKTTTYTYDSADNRTTVIDPLGNVTRFTYNGARQVLTVTDALNHVTTNTFDAAGTNLLSSTDALGKTTSYTYSVVTGQRTSMKDALNGETFYAYDGNGRLSSETDALGHTTSYTYDANGNRRSQTVTRTNALGQMETITTSYEYDKLNRPAKTIYADGSFTRVEYNEIGQQSATLDQLGHRTEFIYDAMGRLARTEYPDGTHEETTYDAEGHRLTSADRAGHVTSYTYNELGSFIKTTYADGAFTSTTYDAAGQVLTNTDARGNVTRYFYDDAGHRTRVKNALDQETTFTYDANGNQLSSTDALGRGTNFEYDAANRRTRTIYADDSVDAVSYDALGRTVSKIDQAGKTTHFVYNALGRLIKVKDAADQETNYSYDELGQQLAQTDANNHTTRFEYDELGRRVRRILPLGQSETYSYDLAGNLQGRIDFNGKATSLTYDAMRRLLSKVPDPSLNQTTVSFNYNANGQRAGMVDASGVTTYGYDSRNRLSNKQTPLGTLSYNYDAAGNLVSTRSSDVHGVSIDYTFDDLNRLATVKDNNVVALNGGITSYSYDPVGNLLKYSYPNQVSSSYTYNSLNRLTHLTVGNAVSGLAGYAYTLGAAGNRTAVTELSGRTTSYSYDDLYRLTGETIASDPHGVTGTLSYGYDSVGNRLSRSSTVAPLASQTSVYDANDRLASDSYDNNGNTTTAGGKNYAYDFENRLTSATVSGAVPVSFVCDGDGNRVAKTVGGITTNYLVDTNNPTGYAQVVEEIQNGAVTRSYTYGHDLISQRCPIPNANCSLSFYGYDGHGSVRLLTDAGGAVTDTYDYDAFGTLISRAGTTGNDYLYAGERFDAELGFYYLRARYMNPGNGRFWSRDTFEGNAFEPRTLHKYSYVASDVVNQVDPSGQIGVGDVISELSALSCRVQLLAMNYPHALAAGRLVLHALNIASFFGDNESRDLYITGAGGPLAAAELLAETAGAIIGASRGILTAASATGGLSKAAVISAERANGLFVNRLGLTAEGADSFVASFEGPVIARIAQPGEQWPRYTGNAASKGHFLANSHFGTAEEAMNALNIRLFGNPATYRQTVTATGRSIVLEGSIRGSNPPGIKQTVILDQGKFHFSTGEKY
jgi:RHS repeat-associated protein